MQLLTGEAIKKAIAHFTYEKKQVTEQHVDLTLKSVARLRRPGRVDFGGSEFTKAEQKVLAPEKKSSEDEYGWWDLAPGAYLITLNESIEPGAGTLGILQPSERITVNGAYHLVTLITEKKEELQLLLLVSPPGIALKENARISKLTIIR